MHVILDLSRLLSRVRYSTPSGVDRVEMAYARGLLSRYGDLLEFSAVHPFGVYGRLPRHRTLLFLDELEQRWAAADDQPRQRSLASVLPQLTALLPSATAPAKAAAIYVQASPHHLGDKKRVQRILMREQAKFLCLVHDLIPIEFPEYARPAGDRQHRRRIETLAQLADAVIVNSAATGRSVAPWLVCSGRQIDLHVALLGTETIRTSALPAPSDPRPYFICVGTIEPRKNHLLLLNLWRSLAETMPAKEVPRLLVIGRRGWENEQVVDMLERCPAIKDHVEELNNCSDTQLASLMRGARALLLPSFAEGYGMPVAEALSIGTPVVCSDLPALREVGDATPDYIDPLDGLGWKAMILDHARRGPAYRDQLRRFAGWRMPTWDQHLGIVGEAIASLQRR